MSDFPITPAYVEPNPLVASGEFERVYVRELEVGDVDPFGGRVVSIERGLGGTTRVEWDTHGIVSAFYRRPTATVLIATR